MRGYGSREWLFLGIVFFEHFFGERQRDARQHHLDAEVREIAGDQVALLDSD